MQQKMQESSEKLRYAAMNRFRGLALPEKTFLNMHSVTLSYVWDVILREPTAADNLLHCEFFAYTVGIPYIITDKLKDIMSSANTSLEKKEALRVLIGSQTHS